MDRKPRKHRKFHFLSKAPQAWRFLHRIKPSDARVVPSSDRKIQQKVRALQKTVHEAEQLDLEIVRLQESSRARFKPLRSLHVFLSVRSRLYYNLHVHPYSTQLNLGALGVFLATLGLSFSAFYTPLIQLRDQPVFVGYISASPEKDSSIFTGDNKNVAVGFSRKDVQTAGFDVVSRLSVIPRPQQYTLGMHLLAENLAIPTEKQLGDQAVSSQWQRDTASGAPVAHAQSGASLPATTVAHVEVRQPTIQHVVYEVTDAIQVRYTMTEWKVKEDITIQERTAITGNSLHFALATEGLVFRQDNDGSWQAFREEDKDRMDNATAVFRLFKPTIHDKNKKQGDITLAIENGRAIYTIDQAFLDEAVYPIIIDPTISPSGRTCTWTNGAGGNVWATAGNWSCTSGSGPPAAGDAVVFDSTSNTAVNAASDSVADDIYTVSLNSGYSSTVTLAKHAINSNDGTPNNYKWDLETLTVNAGNLVLEGDTTVNPDPLPSGCSAEVICGRGMEINANDITVASGATINANEKGFTVNTGPAKGGGSGSTGGGGGGNGGYGGDGSAGAAGGSPIGSATTPSTLGSGGAGGGSNTSTGGGAIKLTVSGTLTNNGTISANATSSSTQTGGASGGSLSISSGTLAGTGSFAANAGNTSGTNPRGGGGGGGRIALSATTTTFSGPVTVSGGTAFSSASRGFAGTIILPSSMMGASGDLVLGGAGNITSLTLGNNVSYTFDTITINSGGTLALDGNVKSGQNCSGVSEGTYCGTGGEVTASTITINSGGKLHADFLGFPAQKGPGVGTYSSVDSMGSGAGYGGMGGESSTGIAGGIGYGSVAAPISLGSGQGLPAFGGGAGGGAIKLTVTGTFSHSGTISADGHGGASGGASGGSIYITAGTLAGNGVIRARGLGTSFGSSGAGGGGRVAVIATTSTFSGTIDANGGINTVGLSGGAGTVYKDIGGTKTITIDNGGTTVNAGTVIAESSLASYGVMTIANGGKLSHAKNSTAETYKIDLTLDGLTIDSTGTVDVSGNGYASQQGTGKGADTADCTGAGGGGYGGAGGTAGGAGGSTYGSATAPTNIGSGGGKSTACSSTGGAGGGAVKLTIDGTLSVTGSIKADGTAGTETYGGGGSGGSIFLVATNFSGSGTVSANGGNGGGEGGGGGGGRIMVLVKGGSNTFDGTRTVTAGTGGSGAGSGTNQIQNHPTATFLTPADGATAVSQNPSITFSATDPEGDYFRAKIEVSTNNFSSTLYTFEQTANTSSFAQGSYSGMNHDSDSNSTQDMYTSGSTVTFTFTSDLTQNQTYYVRVSACDPIGACGALNEFSQTATRSFTIAPISKLIYSTTGNDTTCTDAASAQSIVATQVSSPFYVQICNTLDEAVKVSSDQIVTLATTSGTGTFYSDSEGQNTVTQITISSGSSFGTFYYKDTAVGTPTLTATPSGQSWTAASQQQTIRTDPPVRIQLTLSSSPTQTQTGATLTGTIRAYDQFNTVATDFTGDKTIRFGGANDAPNAPNGQTVDPTATNKTGSAIAFGSDTVITFTSGVSPSLSIVLKATGAAGITVTDYSSGSAGINNTSPVDNTYSIQVIPGSLNGFAIDDYPSGGNQFVTAGFPWDATGSASGPGSPYDLVITAQDAYGNVKYDYTGTLWFTMDPGKSYAFPYDASDNAYTFTWNGSHSSHPIRTSPSDTHDNGRHIFDAASFQVTFTVNTSGTQNLYLNGPGGVITTATIVVKPSSLGSLGIVYSPAMSSETVDTEFDSSVVVTAYDVLGNVKTDYVGKIFFTSTDASATLPYTSGSKYTFQAGDLGTKSLAGSSFAFGSGGNHTLTVTDNTSDPNNPFTATSNVVIVPVHAVSDVTATPGHQSVTLSWTNPNDTAISKVNIYQSTSNGSLGSAIQAQPAVTAGTVSQYTVTGLTNGTTYYFTIKGVHLDPSNNEVESAASTQVSALPAGIAPRDVTAVQESDGRVKITYGLRFDSTVSLSYYNPATLTFADASSGAISGDIGTGITGSEAITSHTAYWTPTTDFPNKFYSSAQGFKIRVNTTVDGQGSASAVSNNMLFDTNPPRVNEGESFMTIDASNGTAATLSLLAREDGSPEQAIQYRLSNSEDMSGATAYTALSAKPTTVSNWNLGESTVVYVEFKDPYNNVKKTSASVINTPGSFALKDGSNIETSDYRLLIIWSGVSTPNFSNYIIERSTNGVDFTQLDTTTKNGYLDVSLNTNITYSYRIRSKDTKNNISRPTVILQSRPGAAPDVTAKPTISVQNWKQEFGVRATVTWDTDQLSDSFVVYSKKPLQAGSSTRTTDGEAAQVVGQFDKTLEHSVLVQQLEPSTRYYFKTLSQNEIKITGASEVVEVVTPERIPLIVSGFTFTNTTPNSTSVKWTTNKLSRTMLEYGETTAYGQRVAVDSLNTDHSIELANLKDGATYHMRVSATDTDENVTVSDDYVLVLPAKPEISGIRVASVNPTSATVTWTTNVNTDSYVEFGADGAFSSTQGNSDATTNHSVVVIGLNPAEQYTFRVLSKDQFGNTAISQSSNFATPSDTLAPVIKNVKSQISTTGSGESLRILAIITWDSDEPATSLVKFGQGLSTDYQQQSQESASLNQSHTVIIGDLKPNTSYQYRVVSKDASGNTAEGEDLTLVTPPQDKSLIRLVADSFRDTFSWTSRVKDLPIIKRFLGK